MLEFKAESGRQILVWSLSREFADCLQLFPIQTGILNFNEFIEVNSLR